MSPFPWTEMRVQITRFPYTHTLWELRRPLTREREYRELCLDPSWHPALTALQMRGTERKALLVPKRKHVSLCHNLSSETALLFIIGKKCVFINLSVINSPFFCTMKSRMAWSWERFPNTRTASRIPSMLLLTRSFKSTGFGNQRNKISKFKFDLKALRNQYHSSIMINTDNLKIKNDTKIQTVVDFSKN